MKKILLCCLLVFLTGCSTETVWETVEDSQSEVKQVWQEQSYTVEIPVLQTMTLVEETYNEQLYVLEGENYEVSSFTYLASSLNSAVKYLSGLEAAEMTVIETSRFGLPEYHFAWYTQTEQGGYLCQADLVMDDTACYAVVVRAPEESSADYAAYSKKVFSAFGLYYREKI